MNEVVSLEESIDWLRYNGLWLIFLFVIPTGITITTFIFQRKKQDIKDFRKSLIWILEESYKRTKDLKKEINVFKGEVILDNRDIKRYDMSYIYEKYNIELGYELIFTLSKHTQNIFSIVSVKVDDRRKNIPYFKGVEKDLKKLSQAIDDGLLDFHYVEKIEKVE